MLARTGVVADSNAAATRKHRASSSAGAMICNPTGNPSDSPLGTEIAGVPASDAGRVHRSLMYIAIGSAARSPMPNATNGDVGETSTSACSYAASKSRTMSVRTFCAWP